MALPFVRGGIVVVEEGIELAEAAGAAGKLTVAEGAVGGEAATLLENAFGAFKGGPLSQVGRALTKHPEVVGLSKASLRLTYGTSGALNAAAEGALRNILANGVRTVETLPRYGLVIQYQVSGGFGARWYAEGEQLGQFIGFINP